MRVTGIRTRVVELPLEGEFRPAWMRGQTQSSFLLTVVEVETDDGITGVTAADGGEEFAVAVERFVAPHLLGQDPTRVELLAGVLRDAEVLGAPVYFMEIALWDIVGKVAGLPVHRLWGAGRDRLPAYCATGELRTSAERVRDVERHLDDGFRAVKLRFHRDDFRDDLAVVAAVRSSLGDRVGLMVDANQAGVLPGLGGHRSWDFATALTVARELERMDVLWLEEPLPRHDYDGLARLRGRLERLRIAGGECNHGLHELRLLVERGCYDVLQPDAVISEGVFQLRKAAAIAEAAHLECVPHTWTNGIGLLANLHLAAALPNCAWLEFPHDPPSGWTADAGNQMLRSRPWIDADGCVAVPEAPGFGFDLDEERLARHEVAARRYSA